MDLGLLGRFGSEREWEKWRWRWFVEEKETSMAPRSRWFLARERECVLYIYAGGGCGDRSDNPLTGPDYLNPELGQNHIM